MMLKKGIGKERLFEELREIDEITTIDSFIKNGEELTVDLIRENGRLSWELKSNLKKMARFKKKGTSLKQLYDTLDEGDSKVFDENLAILCYCDTKTKRTSDGSVVSYWFDIDPVEPYEMKKNGEAVLKTICLTLAEEEYMEMMETGLAFYDPYEDIFYPIKSTSFASLGRFIDCTTAFKRLDSCRLGSAMILAERIYTKDKVRFLCRKTSDRIRPVISVVSSRYNRVRHSDFIRDILDEVAKHSIYRVEKWQIEDGNTIAEVSLVSPGFSHGLFISVGDMIGKSMRVTAFTKVEGNYVYLRTNRLSHKDSEVNIPQLMEGIWDAFSRYEKAWGKLDRCVIDDITAMLEPFKEPLGVARYKELKNEKFERNGKSFFLHLLSETSGRLPEKQRNMIRGQYFTTVIEITEGGEDSVA